MSKVLKFGGKSLASLHQNNDLLNIIESYLKTSSLIVVVSAIGNTTDLLLELLNKAKNNQAYSEELKTLKELNFYPKIDTTSHFQLIENILQGVSLIQDYSTKVQDLLLAQGELISSKVVTELSIKKGLNAIFVDSTQLIKTGDYFSAANVNETLTELNTKETYSKLCDKKLIFVGGFIGSTAGGEITTLGTNGSNLTAALIAKFTEAEEFLNFTLVDGIY